MAPLNFLFRCPRTGMTVQGSAEQPAAEDGSGSRLYTGMHCKACGGWHLVNPKTGKLVSEEGQGRS